MSTRAGGLEARLVSYGSMSLALAAVAMPTGAVAEGLTASPGAPIYFDPATGYSGTAPGRAAGSIDFEIFVTSSNSRLFRDNLLISPDNAALPGNGNLFAVTASSLGGGFSSAAKLTPGTTIGPLMNFSSIFGSLAGNNTVPAAGHWNSLSPVTSDLGLAQTQGCQALQCYGWANITVNSDYTVTLNALGYDSSGDPVTAGEATPEPASVLLLAMGAAGIAAWRRKRTAAR